MDTRRAASVRKWVDLYRRNGFQPLPSDPTPASEGGRKKPLVRFAHLWESWSDDDLFAKFPESNVQVMTGCFWGLCVLDLDGKEAVERVESAWPALPPTWTSWHSGGGRSSRHLWFRTPRGAREKPKTVVWAEWDDDAGTWKKHTAIELLCDRSLITAPPSVHIKTGQPYGFVRGRSPIDCGLATLPDWVWRMPPVVSPIGDTPPPERPPVANPIPPSRSGKYVDYRHVLDSIPDKAGVASQWGLRFAASPGESRGWVSVHDFGREDRNPSARFHLESGRYWVPGGGKTLSLFELGVALGHYRDWAECCNALADYYGLAETRS